MGGKNKTTQKKNRNKASTTGPKKSSKQEQQRAAALHNDAVITDERFAAASTRPQFQAPSKKSAKIVLDDRFASVLTDPRFRVDHGKDKYGRRKGKKKKKQAEAELSAFYTIKDYNDNNDDGDKAEDGNEVAKTDQQGMKEKEVSTSKNNDDDDDNESTTSSSSSITSSKDGEDNDAEEKSDGVDPAVSRIHYLTALSRGEISATSSSSDDDDSSTDDDVDSSDEEVNENDNDSADGTPAGVLDPSSKRNEEPVEITHEPSRYLAILNMDWAHVKAVDLLAILSSFCPPGSVKKIEVYPSDFGLERMAKEEQFGPAVFSKEKETKTGAKEEEHGISDSEDDNGSNKGSNSDGSGDYSSDEEYDEQIPMSGETPNSDFDPEKLRAYEASKLKYYFAIAEFTSTEAADAAYREVDGLELEHSSAAIDLRSIPQDQLESVIEGRSMRDKAARVPSTYEPPDFVVGALQQTSVHCTWEEADTERSKKLTGYGMSTEKWKAYAEGDDLAAYLASDMSSSEDESVDEDKNDKASKLRKLLLGNDGESDNEVSNVNDNKNNKTSSSEEGESSEDEVDELEEGGKEVKFVPGKGSLHDKIRAKLQAKETVELTPWEKYQEKRKQKRRERRQAVRKLRKGLVENEENDDELVSGSDSDHGHDDDDFFVHEDDDNDVPKSRKKSKEKSIKTEKKESKTASTKEELELLLAGDNDEEELRDFDMRGIMKIDKNAGKKLRGKRKRQDAELKATVSGTSFQINTADPRFAAVLDGTDDRFGIDRTDPSFKETPAMREILNTQSKRRRSRKEKEQNQVQVPKDVNADDPMNEPGTSQNGGGAAALSSLVKSLKSKVAKQTTRKN